MKRTPLILALLIFAACNQSSTRPPARLSGTHVVAAAGDLTFIASTDRHELLVIDGVDLDFVRAPNPLELLSIPVVDTPTDIARDLVFKDDGAFATQVAGRYVYAWSRGGLGISAVGAQRESLREEYRVVTFKPITAVAARGTEAGPSTLFFATYGEDQPGSPAGASIYRIDIPRETGEGGRLEAKARAGGFFREGYSITSLAVLPQKLGAGQQLVAAVRATAGGESDVWLIDLQSAFPPVSLLHRDSGSCPAKAADPTVARCGFTAPLREVKVDARRLNQVRVWGVLDESTCTDGTCSGIEVVEVEYAAAFDRPVFVGGQAKVQLARDVTGFPMRRLEPTGGFFTSLDLTRGTADCAPSDIDGCRASVAYHDGFRRDVGLMGLTTQGNGDILVVQGDELRLIDTDEERPTWTVVSRRASGDKPLPPQPEIKMADGAAVEEIIEVTYGGRYLRKTTGPYRLTAQEAALVVAGDRLAPFSEENGDCNVGQTFEFTVDAATGDIAAVGNPPPGCGFELRAGVTTAKPWAAYGSTTGFIGRLADGETIEFPAATDTPTRLSRYYHHSLDLNAAQGVPPQYSIRLADAAGRPDEQKPAEGDAYIVEVNPHFRLLNARVNTAAYLNYFVPAAVARSEVTNRTYVAYPAAGGGPAILSMKLDDFANGTFKIELPYQ